MYITGYFNNVCIRLLIFPREAIQISNSVVEVNYEFNLYVPLIVQLNRILIDCRIMAKWNFYLDN